jgi:uncharacterized protein YecE (DUF72 family)
MAGLYIGTSGWVYGAWKERFYPRGLPSVQRLSFYASKFATTEVNCSYYHLPAVHTYRKWAMLVPPGFLFAIKANRAITHLARLRNVERLWSDFVRGARELQQHLGPILVQLPPSFRTNHDRLNAFLQTASSTDASLRLAFEFRHESWFSEETYELLTRYGAALCIADGIRHPRVNRVTADFTYLRFHGRAPREAPCYTEEELRQEAKLVGELVGRGIDTYVYFNNDALAHAPANAARLTELLNETRRAA